MDPAIVSLNLKYETMFYQQQSPFLSGQEKPNSTFAYFSRGCPHYKSDKMTTYLYKTTSIIPNMIKVDENFWLEDLYKWVETIVNRRIRKNIRELNDIIINELGFNGWFSETSFSNQYIFSDVVIDNYLELVDEIIKNPDYPNEESNGEYFI